MAVARVDVADGPLVRGEETGHAAGTLTLFDAFRPGDGRSGPERPCIGALARGGARHEVEVLGGEAGGGGTQRAGRNLDRRVRGDAQGWVERDDVGVVPELDLAAEDLGEGASVEIDLRASRVGHGVEDTDGSELEGDVEERLAVGRGDGGVIIGLEGNDTYFGDSR